MFGIHLNAYPVTFAGSITFFRFPAERGTRRRAVQQQVGVPLYYSGGYYWATGQPEGVDAEELSFPVGECDLDLLLYATRDGLLDHLHEAGTDAWIGFGGRIHCVGLLADVVIESFILQAELLLAVSEGYASGARALMIASRRTRILYSGDPTDSALRNLIVGQRAIRQRGQGVKTGRIVDVASSTLELATRQSSVIVPAADYVVTANTPLVAQVGGSDLLHEVRVEMDVATPSGKPNPHAVKDRFEATRQMLDKMGAAFALPSDSGEVHVSRTPVRVEVEVA